MITFKIIRKIGKILRGGAGRKEIVLGTVCGVLIGFNPGFSLTLVLAIIITLLLNANISFTLLGAAVGKTLSLLLAPISFHTGFFIIHNMGMEDTFSALCNAPVTALMDLDVYAMVGSLPYALTTGIVLGGVLGTALVRIRKKMLEANQHEIIGKTFGNRVSRGLLWMAFGKSRLSLDEEVITKSPLLRKSGLIVVGVVVLIGALFEFFLLDSMVKRGLEGTISAATGAEVDIAKAHLSLTGGEVSVEGLQVTNPDKPTHNLIQIDRLVADVDVSQLLSGNYAIDLLAGSVLQRDVPRAAPGRVYVKEEKEAAQTELPQDESAGVPLDAYFAKAKAWRRYGEKVYRYLQERKDNAVLASTGKQAEADKDDALARARALGYLRASADLVTDRPAWLIHRIRIDQVDLGGGLPEQFLEATEVSSHPELNRKTSYVSLMPVDGLEPTARVVLRFDDPTAAHALELNLPGMALAGAVESSDRFPLDINDGAADISAQGHFSDDNLDIPFTILVHNLKANVEEGSQVMGMDSDTATQVFSSMEQLEIDGTLDGSLLSPRVRIDYDKLTSNVKDALVAAGKQELANRANAEIDKAKEELKSQAGDQLDKLLGGEEGTSTEDKARGVLRNLF